MVLADLLDEVYNDELNKIYLRYNLINVRRVHDLEDELLGLNIYLPYLVRSWISSDFLLMIMGTENEDSILEKVSDTRLNTAKDNVDEFLNWIKEYPQYNDLLDTGNLEKMNNALKELQVDYESLKKKLK